jgi:LysM repeat protein
MNREIKITLVVLVVLIGVIVLMEMNQSDEVLPEVEPIQELEVLEERPEEVNVPLPEPMESEDGDGSGGFPALEQTGSDTLNEESPAVLDETPEESVVVEMGVDEEVNAVGLSDPDEGLVLSVQEEIPSHYTVQKGDTLSQIAEKILGSVQFVPALLEANPELQPHQLFVGVELEMPTKESLNAVVEAKQSKSEEGSGSGFYRIAKGDSVYRISKKLYGTTKRVAEILELNPNIDPRQLKIGQIIRLPLED